MTKSDARSQANAESRFFAHLAAYAVTVTVVLAVGLLLGQEWVVWVALVWGLVLVAHAVRVFRFFFGDTWVRRRTLTLQGEVSERKVYRMVDEILKARAVPAGTDRALTQLRGRIERLEADVPGRPGDFPPEARVAGRPLPPGAEKPPANARTPVADPFAARRAPIDTPMLDAPPRRRG